MRHDSKSGRGMGTPVITIDVFAYVPLPETSRDEVNKEGKAKGGRFKNSDLFDSKRAGKIYKPPSRERMDARKRINDLLNQDKEEDWF